MLDEDAGFQVDSQAGPVTRTQFGMLSLLRVWRYGGAFFSGTGLRLQDEVRSPKSSCLRPGAANLGSPRLRPLNTRIHASSGAGSRELRSNRGVGTAREGVATCKDCGNHRWANPALTGK